MPTVGVFTRPVTGTAVDPNVVRGNDNALGAAHNTLDGEAVKGPDPASSTDNAVVRWDGVTGRLVQDSGVLIDDAGKLTFTTATTATASATLPHGTAPSSPTNGDVWTTTTGLYARINGATVGPMGDVAGPSSATDNAIVRWDGTSGNLVQNSTVTIQDNGLLSNNVSTQFSGSTQAMSFSVSSSAANDIAIAVQGSAFTSGSNNALIVRGLAASVGHNSSGNVSLGMEALRLTVSRTAGTVAAAYGVRLDAMTNTGTDQYGINIGNVSGAANNYAIYTGTGQVRLGDAVTMTSTLNVQGIATMATASQVSHAATTNGSDPSTFYIRNTTNGTFSNLATWGRLAYYSDDATAPGAGERVRLDATTGALPFGGHTEWHVSILDTSSAWQTVLKATPTGTLLQRPIVTKTTTYSVSALTDYTILCDASGGSLSINLPTAADAKWQEYNIKKIDSSANTVTIDGSGSETIDGATTAVITLQWESVTVQSNGTAWYIL